MSSIKYESFKKDVLNALSEAELTALKKIGMVGQSEAQLRTPVKSGTLKRSITNQVNESEKSVSIGTNIEYAPYVHEGTSTQQPQPFIKDGILDNQEQFKKIISDELKKVK